MEDGSTILLCIVCTVKILVAAQTIFMKSNLNSEHLANPKLHINISSTDNQINNIIHLLNVSLQEYHLKKNACTTKKCVLFSLTST